MVDSSTNSPTVDPDAYPSLLETIQSLGKGYQRFDECSSNFPRSSGRPIIPGIHVPLQVDDRASRDILYGRDDSPDTAAEYDSKQEVVHIERAAAGAQASTSTSAGGPPNVSNVGRGVPPRPPRDIDLIPPPPTGLGPMPYNHLYGDGLGGFTDAFRAKYQIPDDVLVERVTGDRVTFGEDFIIFPLYAITEGG